MSLKEELAEMKNQLAGLKERIEADDAEAIAEGTQLKADIEAKAKEVEQAEAKAALLKSIGKTEDKEDETEMETNNLKNLNMDQLKDQKGSVSTYIKAATDPVTGPTIPAVSERVVDVNHALNVRDLFDNEAIAGNSLTYFVMGATDLPASFDGKTAQGAKKPQIHPNYTPVTAALQKIAAYLKETDELLSDAPYLESVVRGRGVYEQQKAVEAYLISTLLATSGIDATVNTGISFDNLLKAKIAVLENTGYDADAIIINPADLQTLLLTKDGGNSGQYLMGGPAYAPYGNGAYGQYLPIWGMKVVASAAITQGTAIVGAFRPCASVVTKANEGLRVEVSNSNEDDFVKNMVTVRIEERILEAVRLPGGFAKVYTA